MSTQKHQDTVTVIEAMKITVCFEIASDEVLQVCMQVIQILGRYGGKHVMMGNNSGKVQTSKIEVNTSCGHADMSVSRQE